jgi:preprotein translocase subunit SecA
VPQLLTRLFGSRNERLLRTYNRPVREANAFEPKMQALSDAELAAKTPEFRARLKRANASMIFCPKPSRSCAKRRSAP